ncbi:helix-turn-helix domain-containing protein [Rhodococcus sp. GB-02]
MSTQTRPTVPTINELRSGPPTVSIERAGQFLGVSRSYAYRMVKSGRLPTIELGARRKRVPSAALLRMLGAIDDKPRP